MNMDDMSQLRRLAAAQRVSRERTCLLRSPDRSNTAQLLEACLTWCASRGTADTDSEMSDVYCRLCRACDGDGDLRFDCGVFAGRDVGAVCGRLGLSRGEVLSRNGSSQADGKLNPILQIQLILLLHS